MRQIDLVTVMIAALTCLATFAPRQTDAAPASETEKTSADQPKAAASPEQPNDAAPTTAPAAADPAAQARAVLARTVARYRGLKTYQDHLRCTARLKVKDAEAPEMGYLEGSLVFAAPDRLVSKTETQHTYYDGSQLTRYSPHQRQYVVDAGASATAALAPENWFTTGQEGLALHPLVALLALRDMPGEKALMISELSGATPDTHAGRTGTRIRGRLQLTGVPGLPPLDFTAFVNEQTQLFEEISLDITPLLRAFADTDEEDAQQTESAELLIAFEDVVLDAPLPDETFVFHPAGARKVAHLGFVEEPTPNPLDLLGQPAPAFSGATLIGENFDLAAQRGHVLVLAFWARCCPRAGDFLDQLEALARAHSDDPLKVVAISRSAAHGAQPLRPETTRQNANLVQIVDDDPASVENWHISALPAVFLIDQQGTVAEAYPTWDAESCARQVAALLRGETLYTPEAQAARRAAASDTPGGLALHVPTSQPTSARLQAGESQSLMASTWNMSQQDVDGDGEVELIFPGWTRDLSVVKPSTGEVSNIPLRGLENASVESARAVTIDGDNCWLCTVQRSLSTADGLGRQVQISLYAPGGELLWTFTPDVPEKSSCSAVAAAGDLDGDGDVEYAIGLSTYVLTQMSENTWRRSDATSRLLVLDRDGRLIDQQEFPSQVELLYVAPAKPDHPASLLCLSGGELRRFWLVPGSPSKK